MLVDLLLAVVLLLEHHVGSTQKPDAFRTDAEVRSQLITAKLRPVYIDRFFDDCLLDFMSLEQSHQDLVSKCAFGVWRGFVLFGTCIIHWRLRWISHSRTLLLDLLDKSL